ncbi:MAG: hypothetical protein LUE24_14730, partial [Lachnospiraceae bacterium]|nr:hypothetical protein [Lachnospiraceae bacterium]
TETIPTWASDIWSNKIVPFFTETIPGFFTSLWDSVTAFVTEAIPTWASNIWGTISGWFSNISSWFSNLWSNISGNFSSGYSSATGHAWGGIMTAPHMGVVAEDGAEAIIPLSPSKSERGMDLWLKTGQLLGVRAYADGGIAGDTNEVVAAQTSTADAGGSRTPVEVKIEMHPEFRIEGDNMDEESIIAVIKAHIREMADDLSDEMAERLARAFANMPLKGGA